MKRLKPTRQELEQHKILHHSVSAGQYVKWSFVQKMSESLQAILARQIELPKRNEDNYIVPIDSFEYWVALVTKESPSATAQQPLHERIITIIAEEEEEEENEVEIKVVRRK